MASTIQLKTGTGSAVPTSLAQGEVAINIDNGLVYYGSGSGNTVKQLESFNNIIGSGNLIISGTATFGTSKVIINGPAGHITASGNISASGNIIGSTSYFSRTIITLNSTDLAAEASPFLITIADNNGQDEKLQVNHEGVLRFGALTTLPTAVTGGLVYSASNFYMGIS